MFDPEIGIQDFIKPGSILVHHTSRSVSLAWKASRKMKLKNLQIIDFPVSDRDMGAIIHVIIMGSVN